MTNVHFIEEQLNQNKSVLNLSNRLINLTEMQELSTYFRNNNTTEDLDLSGNNLTSEVLEPLLESLTLNTCMKKLNLRNNSLSGKFSVGFSKLLEHNASLTECDLSNNQLGLFNFNLLALAIQKNTSITVLNLRKNVISTRDAQSLLKAIKKNKVLVKLNIEENKIEPGLVEKIHHYLKRNRQLKALETCLSQLEEKAVFPSNQGEEIFDNLKHIKTLLSDLNEKYEMDLTEYHHRFYVSLGCLYTHYMMEGNGKLNSDYYKLAESYYDRVPASSKYYLAACYQQGIMYLLAKPSEENSIEKTTRLYKALVAFKNAAGYTVKQDSAEKKLKLTYKDFLQQKEVAAFLSENKVETDDLQTLIDSIDKIVPQASAVKPSFFQKMQDRFKIRSDARQSEQQIEVKNSLKNHPA